MRARRVALGLATLAVVATALPTGGFTSVGAERGVAVDVAPDDEAFLGVEISERERSVDEPAISFVGFCTADESELAPSAAVTTYKPEVDRQNATEEALAVRWETDEPPSAVVLKTGGGATALEAVDVDGRTSGEVAVGDGAAATNRSPSDYCPEGEHEAGKLDADDGDLGVDDDASPAGEALAVTVTNRFAEPLTTVEVTAGGATRTLSDAGRSDLGPGESVTVTFDDADCETVAVEARGEDTEVSLERACP